MVVEIKTAPNEVIRIKYYKQKVGPFVDVRLYQNGRPTQNGISLIPALIPALIEALKDAVPESEVSRFCRGNQAEATK